MRKGVIRLSLAAIAASCLAAGGLAGASGSCPNTGATGTSVAVDPGLGAKACGTWNPATNQGHLWITGLGGYAPPQTTPAGTVNGFYVAAGNDSAGNPDGGNGANTGCAWDERANKYDVGNDPTRPCPARDKSGPYVCVATNGGPAYGPKDGIVACPVNQP